MSEQNKSLVRRFVDEIWNKKNAGKLEEFLSPQYSAQTPDGMIHNLKEYKQYHETFTRAFPDCRFTIDELLAENDIVSARYTITGTHRGELRGIAATGKNVKVQGMAQVRVSAGKLSDAIVVWDRLSLLEQLGVAVEGVKPAARKAGR